MLSRLKLIQKAQNCMCAKLKLIIFLPDKNMHENTLPNQKKFEPQIGWDQFRGGFANEWPKNRVSGVKQFFLLIK